MFSSLFYVRLDVSFLFPLLREARFSNKKAFFSLNMPLSINVKAPINGNHYLLLLSDVVTRETHPSRRNLNLSAWVVYVILTEELKTLNLGKFLSNFISWVNKIFPQMSTFLLAVISPLQPNLKDGKFVYEKFFDECLYIEIFIVILVFWQRITYLKYWYIGNKVLVVKHVTNLKTQHSAETVNIIACGNTAKYIR